MPGEGGHRPDSPGRREQPVLRAASAAHTVAWSACKDAIRDVDGCDCTRMHAVPYTLSVDDDNPPLLSLLDEPDVRYRGRFSA